MGAGILQQTLRVTRLLIAGNKMMFMGARQAQTVLPVQPKQ